MNMIIKVQKMKKILKLKNPIKIIQKKHQYQIQSQKAREFLFIQISRTDHSETIIIIKWLETLQILKLCQKSTSMGRLHKQKVNTTNRIMMSNSKNKFE
jgi:hypothetical protein